MREKLFVSICFFFVLFSFLPTAYELYNRNKIQSNRSFELVHNFPTDYNFYLSRIRQGIEGRTTIVEKYTSEPHQGSFIHIFYLFLGRLGQWSRVPWERGGDVYHVARFVLAGTLLFAIAFFTKKSFVQFGWQYIAFLLAVTASTWPKLVFYNGGWRFGGYMPWWSVMDSLQRISFIPHLLAGQSLLLFLVVGICNRDTMKKTGNWIFLGLLAFLLGIIFPPGLLFVLVGLCVLSVIEFIMDFSLFIFNRNDIRNWLTTHILPRAIIVGIAVPSLLYLQLMTSFYPWKRLAEFDIVKPLPFSYSEYLLAVGPILLVGILGLLFALIRKKKELMPSIIWVITWMILLFIFQYIPQQSPLRFSEMIPHVPLAVLATYMCFEFIKRIQTMQYFHRSRHPFLKHGVLFMLHMLFVLPMLLGVGVLYSSWLWQKDFIDHKMSASYPLVQTGSYVMYPLKDFLLAMKFIQDNTPRDSVILSENTAGNYIPVYSGNTVYVGHANTVRAEQKEAEVKEFFSGRMKINDAKSWLREKNLHTVFFGPQEQEDGSIQDLASVYPFLNPVYRNTFVIVYSVTQ